MSNLELRYRFHPDVVAVVRDGRRFTLTVANWQPITFTTPSEALADAIAALEGEGATLETLLRLAGTHAGNDAESRVQSYLERFRRGRLLEWCVTGDGGDAAVLRPLIKGFEFAEVAPPAGLTRLSRFAFLRRREEGVVLESAESRCRLLLLDWRAEWLGVADGTAGGDMAFIRDLLWRAGFLEAEAAEEGEARACWEFADLLLHCASRNVHDEQRIGGTYRFETRFPSPPAIKPPMAGEDVALPALDPTRLEMESDGLESVMKRRRSDRDFSPDLPLSLAALSEFLYRVARVEGVVDAEPQELMTRPYPAGGSIHELEFYLAIERCDGLEPGFYHYDGHRHGLRLLRHGDEAASPFVTRSASAMGLADRRPQMVVLISTRLPRLAWKYEGMAYRASLLNVGVVFQTMYLVATDMGLACCANGTGSIADFAEKTGLDVFEETAIGEVAIGVRE